MTGAPCARRSSGDWFGLVLAARQCLAASHRAGSARWAGWAALNGVCAISSDLRRPGAGQHAPSSADVTGLLTRERRQTC